MKSMTPYIQKVEEKILKIANEWAVEGGVIPLRDEITQLLTHSLEEYKRLVLEALPKYKMPDLKKQVDASTKAEIFSSFGHNELLREIRDKIQSL